MKNSIRTGLVLALASAWQIGVAAAPLPRSTPEAQGVSATAMLQFVNALGQIDGLHGVVVVRHGQVITEGWWAPYDAEHQHVLYSLSKSFTSSAVGLAVAEGKMSIDDPVLKFFPDAAPASPSDNLKAMRVRDLLMMSTGHQDEPPTAPDKVSAQSFLAWPVPHLPGTHFKYNTAASFMLSAIVQKVTGQTELEYLRPRLFEPLGIEQPVWDTNFQGICLGGYGLRVRTEDIAKFGLLYLQRGQWQDRQLLPESWVALATARQTSNGSNPDSDWNQGYGFQFWRCRHNAFRGDGAFGQYCVVMPDQDTVVAINSGVKDMQAVLNAIWNQLLPNLQSAALPADPPAVAKLADTLAHLTVSPAQGAATSPQVAQLLNRKFVFPANDQKLESLTLTGSDPAQTLTLTLRVAGADVAIPCGYHDWQKTRAPFYAGKLANFPDEPTAGTFAWAADNTCAVKLCAFETPYHRLLTLKFDSNQVTLDSELNVSFVATKLPPLVGQAE
jgi:CubicO group peptidase (beta-lactamase class C family)